MADPAAPPREIAPVLRGTFPGAADPALALALVRTLAQGRPVATETLARDLRREDAAVAAQLDAWPAVERDRSGVVVGFCGLTLRPTAHRFEVAGRVLHTWCAWDTLFLPGLLDTTARVRSTCPVSGQAVELVVAPDAVLSSSHADLSVSFPPLGATDFRDILNSFCCHVHFLTGDTAAADWRAANPGGYVLGLDTAFERGRDAASPLRSPNETEVSRNA
jgi:alkylmercury lyase